MMPRTFPWIELPCLQYEQKVPVGSSYVKLNKIIYLKKVLLGIYKLTKKRHRKVGLYQKIYVLL